MVDNAIQSFDFKIRSRKGEKTVKYHWRSSADAHASARIQLNMWEVIADYSRVDLTSDEEAKKAREVLDLM